MLPKKCLRLYIAWQVLLLWRVVLFLTLLRKIIPKGFPPRRKKTWQSSRGLPSRLYLIWKRMNKPYKRMHQHQPLTVPSEPRFSDFYQPSSLQKQRKLIFVGTGTLALGYAAFRFLWLPCVLPMLCKFYLERFFSAFFLNEIEFFDQVKISLWRA